LTSQIKKGGQKKGDKKRGTGDTLFLVEPPTGKEVWSGKAEGEVHGLTAANGALFVSASSGAIHCFKDTNE